jgi:hypothetical protein
VDTSSLLTASVERGLLGDVRAVLEKAQTAYLRVVADEMSNVEVGGWAAMTGRALDHYAWLGTPIEIDDPDILERAGEIQRMVANGRPLERPGHHLAESVILAVAETATKSRPIMLSEDYDARVAAKDLGVKSMSIHRLLYNMIGQGRIEPSRAWAHAEAIRLAGRGPDFTEAELITGRLGRTGRP